MKNKKPFLQTLDGNITENIPFWFMRQAGRYLPEYREIRSKAGGFLNMVYHPENAAEVTVQPLRRFDMSAAILFSDILVIPHALGQKLEFMTSEGPKLDALNTQEDLIILNSDKIDDVLNPIYETVSLTRQKMKEEGFDKTALIGFAGSPWTVATYMVEGSGSKTYEKIKTWAYSDPNGFQKLIDILVESTTHYLCRQIEAGAEALQLFDSWSGVLDEDNFNRWVITPTAQIVTGVKEKHPDIPIIGFPRGAGTYALDYAKETEINAIGLDFTMSPKWANEHLQGMMPVQGNLDPVSLLVGGTQMEKKTQKILETFGNKPFIFNLGHGIIKETPIENIEKLCDMIRKYKR